MQLDLTCTFSLQDFSFCLLFLYNKLHSQVTKHKDSRYCMTFLCILKGHMPKETILQSKPAAVLHIKCH